MLQKQPQPQMRNTRLRNRPFSLPITRLNGR